MDTRSEAGSRRLRRRLALAGCALSALVLGATLIASIALEAGRAQLEAVERVRELETSVERLLRDARRYREHAPRDYPDYWRDTTLYYRQLRDDVAQVRDAILRLESGLGASEGRSGLLLARRQQAVARAAARKLLAYWLSFEQGLEQRIGPDKDEPRLEWAAIFVVERAGELLQQVDSVGATTAALVDANLDTVSLLGRFILPGSLIAAVAALAWGFGVVFRRLRSTLAVCSRVARGEFGLVSGLAGKDEIGELAAAVDVISLRARVVLDAIAALQDASEPGRALAQALPALSRLTPVRALAVFDADSLLAEGALLARAPESLILPGALRLPASASASQAAIIERSPGTAELTAAFERAGYADVLMLALPRRAGKVRLLVVAGDRQGQLQQEVGELLLALAPIIVQAIDRAHLTEQLLLASVRGLAALAESRDPETGRHLERMALYSRFIAEAMAARDPSGRLGLDSQRIDMIQRFAPMHDIGKVGVDDAILRKPGKLTAQETEAMRLHPVIGGAVLRACQAQLPAQHQDLFQVAIEIAEGHHERFDGGGYPAGLRGERIPLAARIVAAADVLDALTTRRPYKAPWPLQQAFDYLLEQSGSHFDPVVVEAALVSRERIALIAERLQDEEDSTADPTSRAPATALPFIPPLHAT